MLRYSLWLLPLSLAVAAFAAEPITVKPTEIIDTRVGQLVKKEGFFGMPAGLAVQVHVEGDAVTGAASFGKMKFTQATDDAGTDLKPKPAGFGMGMVMGGGRLLVAVVTFAGFSLLMHAYPFILPPSWPTVVAPSTKFWTIRRAHPRMLPQR